MAIHIRRREFIAALGGMAATWPLAARAQQGERMRRIGVLMALAADDPTGQARLIAFVQALQELGWTDGRNVRIATRWAAGDADRFRRYAAELVALAPDVILASGGTGVGALLQATHTVPIVFTQTNDPVGAGEQRRRHVEAERTSGRQVDDEVELGRLHHRQVGGLIALEDTTRIDCKLTIRVRHTRPIAHEATVFHIRAHSVGCGNGMARRQRDDLHVTAGEERIGVRP